MKKGEVAVKESSVVVTMPVATASVADDVCMQQHSHVAKLLLKHKPQHFKCRLTLIDANSSVDIEIDKDFAASLPLLEHLLGKSDSAPRNASKKRSKATKSTVKGSQHGTSHAVNVPFEPPASACGLVCLLLLLEGTASPASLFLTRPWGQDFISHTAWVRFTVSMNLFTDRPRSLT